MIYIYIYIIYIYIIYIYRDLPKVIKVTEKAISTSWKSEK